MSEENTFINNRPVDEFEEKNENHNIKTTVYNTVPDGVMFKENEYNNLP